MHSPLYLSRIYPVFLTISKRLAYLQSSALGLVFFWSPYFTGLLKSALAFEFTVEEVNEFLQLDDGIEVEFSVMSPFVNITFAYSLNDLCFVFFYLFRLRCLFPFDPIT
jgi:hypothetical protein